MLSIDWPSIMHRNQGDFLARLEFLLLIQNAGFPGFDLDWRCLKGCKIQTKTLLGQKGYWQRVFVVNRKQEINRNRAFETVWNMKFRSLPCAVSVLRFAFAIFHPEGIPEISRWLSEATPPETVG